MKVLILSVSSYRIVKQQLNFKYTCQRYINTRPFLTNTSIQFVYLPRWSKGIIGITIKEATIKTDLFRWMYFSSRKLLAVQLRKNKPLKRFYHCSLSVYFVHQWVNCFLSRTTHGHKKWSPFFRKRKTFLSNQTGKKFFIKLGLNFIEFFFFWKPLHKTDAVFLVFRQIQAARSFNMTEWDLSIMKL